LGYYSRAFDFVEIDSSFYRIPNLFTASHGDRRRYGTNYLEVEKKTSQDIGSFPMEVSPALSENFGLQ
jgi:hypothetical protein